MESIRPIIIIGKCLLLRKNLNSRNCISIIETAIKFIDCLLIWKVWISVSSKPIQFNANVVIKNFNAHNWNFFKFQQIPRNMFVMIVIPKFSLCSVFTVCICVDYLPTFKRCSHCTYTLLLLIDVTFEVIILLFIFQRIELPFHNNLSIPFT